MPSACHPYRSRFFHFDIQNFHNIATSGVHTSPTGNPRSTTALKALAELGGKTKHNHLGSQCTPLWGPCPPWEILDPQLDRVTSLTSKVITKQLSFSDILGLISLIMLHQVLQQVMKLNYKKDFILILKGLGRKIRWKVTIHGWAST